MLGRKKSDQQSSRQAKKIQGQRAPVFSYYSSRSNTESGRSQRAVQADISPARRKSERAWWIGYLPSIIALGVIIAAGLYLTTLAASARIIVVASDSQAALIQENQVYEQAANEELKNSLLNRSKLTIDTNKLAETLQKKFPELGDVVVTVPLISRRPIITVQPSQPALILSGQQEAYVIDSNGRPIVKASLARSGVTNNLPLVSDDTGALKMEIGKQAVTTDLVSFIRQVQAQYRAKQIKVQSYTIPALANELHVRVEGQGYYIKMNTEADVRVQIGTYIAISEKLTADGIVPAEYIDVRIEERAYYK